jgi:hypothetical protein
MKLKTFCKKTGLTPAEVFRLEENKKLTIERRKVQRGESIRVNASKAVLREYKKFVPRTRVFTMNTLVPGYVMRVVMVLKVDAGFIEKPNHHYGTITGCEIVRR